MIVAIEGVKRISGLDFFIFKEPISEVKVFVVRAQAQEHEECISCLYSLSSIAQHCVCSHIWQWSQWIALWLCRTSL